MKGLLIKDFKLMKGQKNFLFAIIAIAVFLSAFFDNALFVISYLSFVLSLFSLSSISYDEFDNGNAFLFTLPFSRKEYAVEKYLFAFMAGGSALIFSTVLVVTFGIIRSNHYFTEIAFTFLIMIPILFIVQSIMIPVQLNFGAEKGRTAIIVILGIFFTVVIAGVKILQFIGIDISGELDKLSFVNIGILISAFIAISIIILISSIKISVSIINNKEF